MSMKTWKAEFYPVDAIRAACGTPLEAARHSLKKWQGRLPENLERHAVEVEMAHGVVCVGNEVHELRFNGDSCALCCLPSVTEADNCRSCPLFQARGGYSCDAPRPEEALAPYHAETPDAMIAWLEKTVAYCEKQGQES